jgi:hypothetical protein
MSSLLKGYINVPRKEEVIKIISIELKRKSSNPKRFGDRVVGVRLLLEIEELSGVITFLDCLISSRNFYQFIFPDLHLPISSIEPQNYRIFE